MTAKNIDLEKLVSIANRYHTEIKSRPADIQRDYAQERVEERDGKYIAECIELLKIPQEEVEFPATEYKCKHCNNVIRMRDNKKTCLTRDCRFFLQTDPQIMTKIPQGEAGKTVCIGCPKCDRETDFTLEQFENRMQCMKCSVCGHSDTVDNWFSGSGMNWGDAVDSLREEAEEKTILLECPAMRCCHDQEISLSHYNDGKYVKCDSCGNECPADDWLDNNEKETIMNDSKSFHVTATNCGGLSEQSEEKTNYPNPMSMDSGHNPDAAEYDDGDEFEDEEWITSETDAGKVAIIKAAMENECHGGNQDIESAEKSNLGYRWKKLNTRVSDNVCAIADDMLICNTPMRIKNPNFKPKKEPPKFGDVFVEDGSSQHYIYIITENDKVLLRYVDREEFVNTDTKDFTYNWVFTGEILDLSALAGGES